MRDDEPLVLEFWARVYELFRWRGGLCHHDAEDLAQNFMLQMLRRGRRCCHLGEGGMEPPLLRTSAWRFFLNWWRGQQRGLRRLPMISWQEWQAEDQRGMDGVQELVCQRSPTLDEREERLQRHRFLEQALATLQEDCGAALARQFEARFLDPTPRGQIQPMSTAERTRLCRSLSRIRRSWHEAQASRSLG